jgi:hypothetical protein
MNRFVWQAAVILLLAIFVSVLIISCGTGNNNDDVIGGPCTYNNIPGTANIISIGTVTGGVAVSFVFTPTDPNVTPKYGEGNNGTLFTAGGSLPSAGLISLNGITLGETFPAVREEINTGTCTPWLYTFPTLTSLYGG